MWNVREAFRAIFQRGESRVDGELDPKVGIVLRRLGKFCRADKSCVQFGKDGRVDPLLSAVVEGRREAFLEIVRVLKVTDTELMKLMDDKDAVSP